MKRACFLCRETTPDGTCYVRIGKEERCSCRSCWEQVLLNPKGFVRHLGDSNLELQTLLGACATP